jgi:hypothetical protein
MGGKRYKPWELANNVLYKLCADNPKHESAEVIIAKFWIIGRTYAAALERRRVTGDVRGDDFYTKSLVPLIQKSDIDAWFVNLKGDHVNDATLNIEIHKWLVDQLSTIASSNKRSLASKYLHFHFPNRFYMYDTRAVASLRELMRGVKLPKQKHPKKADRDYAIFYHRCDFYKREMEAHHKREFSHRQFDFILTGWADRKLRRKERIRSG